MFSSIKARTLILALVLAISSFGYAYAQNKMVVIPLGSDVTAAQFNELEARVLALELLPEPPPAPTAWGSFRGNASIRAKTENIVEILHPSVGKYCVVFNVSISGARLESSMITGGGSGPVIGDINNGIGGLDGCLGNTSGFTGLQVTLYDENGSLSDERFSVIVP